jgi:hypothetical protein
LSDEIKIEAPENTKIGSAKKNVSENENSSKKLSIGYLDVIGIALIVVVLTVTVYDQFFASKVVMVDLTGFVKEQIELFTQGKIGEADVASRLAEFQELVKKQPKNLTVITKDVVLANGREIPISMGVLPAAPTVSKSPAGTEKK